MAVNTSLGATIKITAGIPSTYDAAGYGALSFTLINNVDKIPKFGASSSLKEFTPVDTGIKQKFKGVKDGGSPTITLGLDTDDAGQILLKEARASQRAYAFKVTMPNGDAYYFMAMVMNFDVSPEGADDIAMAEAQLAITGQSGGTLIIEVMAA